MCLIITMFEQDIALHVHVYVCSTLLAISYHHSGPDSTAWRRNTTGRKKEEEESEHLAIVVYCTYQVDFINQVDLFPSAKKSSEFICCLRFTVCLKCGMYSSFTLRWRCFFSRTSCSCSRRVAVHCWPLSHPWPLKVWLCQKKTVKACFCPSSHACTHLLLSYSCLFRLSSQTILYLAHTHMLYAVICLHV